MVSEPLNILLLVSEREGNQPIGRARTRAHLPDRGTVGVEVPVPRRETLVPVDEDMAAVAWVLADHPARLDAQDGDIVAPVVEWKVAFLNEGRLDRDLLAGLHRPDLRGFARRWLIDFPDFVPQE